MIKAIETVYKGYRFRSRLEARWAVFFDCLDIPWQYEKEGYNLDGVYYLPDFWLINEKCFVEIKPITSWVYSAVCDKLSFLYPVLYVAGEPYLDQNNPKSYYAIAYYEKGVQYLDNEHPYYFAMGCKDDRELWIRQSRQDYLDEVHCLRAISNDRLREPEMFSDRLIYAYSKARQARFEHGETGRPG